MQTNLLLLTSSTITNTSFPTKSFNRLSVSDDAITFCKEHSNA